MDRGAYDKILLSESTPKELALFLNTTISDKIRLIFIPDNNTCKYGSKTHKHTIIQWIMDKKIHFFISIIIFVLNVENHLNLSWKGLLSMDVAILKKFVILL